jgi:phage/plasmid-associated DNA primase
MTQKHIVPFENGVYDLKKSKFITTTREDGIVVYNDYHYNAKLIDEDIRKELLCSMQKIVEPKYFEDVLMYYGYCLTGHTTNRSFLINKGVGSNGKSAIMSMYAITMPAFFLIVDSDTFNDSYSKAHKFLVQTEYKRVVHCEELKAERLNASLIKQCVDIDPTINVEVLNSTSQLIDIHWKLIFNTNNFPNWKPTDNAIVERGKLLENKSKFVKKSKAHLVDETNRIFLEDPLFKHKFKSDMRYRMTFFDILAKYARKFYDNNQEFEMHNDFQANLEDIAYAQDPVAQVLQEHFIQTKSENDKINHTEFYKYFNNKLERSQRFENEIDFKNSMISHNLIYNKNRYDKKIRGVYQKIKYVKDPEEIKVNDIEDSDSDSDY